MIDNYGTRHARSCLIVIAARERPRAGSKQVATYQAVAQAQSSWSSSCERTSPRCGRKHMATYQAGAQTQSSCLIAARERPRAGSKQMATYQAVVAQTQSSSSASNLCCSVATQTWSAHVARSLLHTIHYASSMNAVWRTHTQRRPQTALLLLLYIIFSHTQQQHACCTSLSPSIFPTCLFSTKNKLAKLKALLRVQPSGRRKDEPQRGFISVRYYEV